MRTKQRTLSIGTISEGTLRPEDLIPALVYELRQIRLSRADRSTVQAIDRASSRTSYFEDTIAEDTDPGEDLQALYDIGDRYVPDYAYLGSIEGDGACIGVWPSWDSLNDDRHSGDVPSGDQLPAGRPATDYFLVVSDHGNGTLYRRAGTRWIECWSVV